jgi:hypothetical protein
MVEVPAGLTESTMLKAVLKGEQFAVPRKPRLSLVNGLTAPSKPELQPASTTGDDSHPSRRPKTMEV